MKVNRNLITNGKTIVLRESNGPETIDTIILEVKNLTKYFPAKSSFLNLRTGWIKAVDKVNLQVKGGETLGIVGESGCGKSTLGKTISGIYRPTAGAVYFRVEGKELQRIDNLPPKKIRKAYRSIQYLHQDPASCLDPWWKIGRSVREPLKIHQKNLSKKEMDQRVKEILEAVGLEADHVRRYQHEFSGGQQRRIGLARILILNPSLVILDEPTSGLDVSVQATILNFCEQLKNRFNLTYIHISHNLAVIRSVSHRIGVMYLGRIVELGDARQIWDYPLHPYTKILFSALPKISSNADKTVGKFVTTGEPPDPQNPPSGCHFHPRCPIVEQICTVEEPALINVDENRHVACHKVAGSW